MTKPDTVTAETIHRIEDDPAVELVRRPRGASPPFTLWQEAQARLAARGGGRRK